VNHTYGTLALTRISLPRNGNPGPRRVPTRCSTAGIPALRPPSLFVCPCVTIPVRQRWSRSGVRLDLRTFRFAGQSGGIEGTDGCHCSVFIVYLILWRPRVSNPFLNQMSRLLRRWTHTLSGLTEGRTTVDGVANGLAMLSAVWLVHMSLGKVGVYRLFSLLRWLLASQVLAYQTGMLRYASTNTVLLWGARY
jgi:hypothetical protein